VHRWHQLSFVDDEPNYPSGGFLPFLSPCVFEFVLGAKLVITTATAGCSRRFDRPYHVIFPSPITWTPRGTVDS
jgi:hypothetical protein